MGVRSSLAKADQVERSTGFGKQEGIARVENARFIAVQHQQGEKKGGGLVTPFFCLQLDEIYLDKETMKPVDDAAPEPVNYIIGWGHSAKKNAQGVTVEEAKPIFRFWPANGKSATDPDLEDVGMSNIDGEAKMKLVEIGAEGNTLVSEDGISPYTDSDASIFMSQLEAKGFSPEVIAHGYAPDYIGLVYEFKTTEKEVIFKRQGVKFQPSTKIDVRTGKPEIMFCREVVQIHERPYEKKGGAKSGAGKPGAAKSGSTGSTTTKTPAPVEADDKTATRTDEIIGKWIADNAGKELPSRSKFYSAIGAKLIDGKTGIGMPATTAWTNQMKALSDDEFGTLGMKYGFTFEDGKVTVNEAE